FDSLDAPFDFSHIFEVLIQAAAIRRAKVALEARYFMSDPIENAAIGLTPGRTFRGCSTSSKQLIEHGPRITDHRQWPRRRGPTDGAHVHAGISIMASAGVVVFNRELDGGNGSILAELLSVELVHRDSRIDVRTDGLFRFRLRQVHCRRTIVIAADFIV